MSSKITPFVWANHNAKEMAEYYMGVFPGAKIVNGNPFVVEVEIFGQRMAALNGGPEFVPNPSISFSVWLKDEALTKRIWDGLAEGGTVMMEFGAYHWSKAYGWCSDRYGVSRQIMYDERDDHEEAIVPSLMYTGAVVGKTEEAMQFYTSMFEHSSVTSIYRYGPGEGDVEGYIAHAEFVLAGQKFIAMDSSADHKFSFNEGVSLAISCDGQEEVDYFWNKLTADGGVESQCGRCKDKYGVDRQVVPVQLQHALFQPDQEKAQYAMQAMMKMKKIVISELQE